MSDLKIRPQSCRSCKHYDPAEGQDGIGECHRFPPSTQLFLMGVDKASGQPTFHRAVVTQTTPAEYWCGEYLLKLSLQ